MLLGEATSVNIPFMPITSSAKKAYRSSLRKRVFNDRKRKALHDSVKNVRKLVIQSNIAEAKKLLPLAYKAIDKAAKTGVIKPNTASRKKSRLARFIAMAK